MEPCGAILISSVINIFHFDVSLTSIGFDILHLPEWE